MVRIAQSDRYYALLHSLSRVSDFQTKLTFLLTKVPPGVLFHSFEGGYAPTSDVAPPIACGPYRSWTITDCNGSLHECRYANKYVGRRESFHCWPYAEMRSTSHAGSAGR